MTNHARRDRDWSVHVRNCRWCNARIKPDNPSGKFYDPWEKNQRWAHVVGGEHTCANELQFYVWPSDHPEAYALPDRECFDCGHSWREHEVFFEDDRGLPCGTYVRDGQFKYPCACRNAPRRPIVFDQMRKLTP